jgi:aspartate--ammonia ligase
MAVLTIPTNYKNLLSVKDTENAIKLIKDTFEHNISSELKLRRITAPLFVLKGTGINDDLNGVEQKVTFQIRDIRSQEAEIVNSLAKWKRMALANLKINPGYGIYTDMNAIRPDEEMDNIHSIYVDQWDWEQVLPAKQRNLDYLKTTVRKIYEAIKRTEYTICDAYPHIKPSLPNDITFFHSEELLLKYPNQTPKEREKLVTREYGAVFIIGIGGALSDGNIHDGRAPDYDDWVTPAENGYKGLNGDILIWYPVLDIALELSSMGIRVNRDSLLTQLKISGSEDRKDLLFHKKLLNNELPLSIGGGIGQSRLCMLFLRKAHIGEVQSSIWPEHIITECERNNIHIL